MKGIKYICLTLVITVFVSLFSGCTKRVKVPDIMDKNEKQAVEMIKDAGLVPIVEYEYNDTDKKGEILKVSPRIGNNAELGSEVIIYISKGPEKVVAKNAYRAIIAENLDLGFPYVDKNTLYIECYNVAFKEGVTWEKSEEDGVAVTEASLTKDFEETIPAKIKYEKGYTAPLEKQNFVIEIPAEYLGEELPESISVRLNLIKDELPEGKVEELVPEEMQLEKDGIRIDFMIEW